MAPYHPLLAFSVNHPSQNAAFGTRRRLRRNERNTHTRFVRWERGVCEPHAKTDICLTQWLLLSSHLCGGGGRKEGVEEGVTLDGGIGRGGDGGESSQGSRSRQNATPKKETRLTPCTRAHGLWDANVEKEACRHQWHSSWDFQVQAFAHLSNVRRRFLSQAGTRMMCSSWEDPSVLLRYLWLQDLLCGCVLRKSDTRTRAVYGVSVWRPWASSQGVNSPCT